ncbi:MAG: hypothetical protein GY913_07040 [Proteobacteria bacterium]|nr:hypothetical protein [Pseudomonadota bacterium]
MEVAVDEAEPETEEVVAEAEPVMQFPDASGKWRGAHDGDMHFEGTATGDPGIENWSITIADSTALVSGYPEGTEDPVDETVDTSEWEGTGEQTAALWVRPTDGTAVVIDTCDIEVACTEEATEACSGGDPNYYDSCGNKGSRIDTCSSSESCVESGGSATCDADCGNGTVDSGEDCDGTDMDSNTCLTEGYDSGSISCSSSCTLDVSDCCTDDAYTQCYDDDVYYYDSCGSRGSKKTDCGTTSGCENTSSSRSVSSSKARDGPA